MNYNFQSGKTLLEICEEAKITIAEAAYLRETQLTGATKKKIDKKMKQSWDVMKASVYDAVGGKGSDIGGKIIGGESKKIKKYIKNKKQICGSLMSNVIAYSMAVPEVNASMGLIVAAPTAGSSGVIPGVFVGLQEEYKFSDEEIINALYTAGAVGVLIQRNASVAGAEAGCQAEIGSAAAMAAAGVCALFGGSNKQMLDAASYVLANMLGLVCDPIGGLVECPCQSRNAAGAVNALTAAEIVLAGVPNHIPFDEMAQCMYEVGLRMPFELRETALGGVATTPSACALCKKIGICTD